MQKIQIFDTTLRDGTQGEKISLSVDDKLKIAQRLDQFGVDYIEGGWPGSNPKDRLFFEKAKNLRFQHAKLVAFGSTHHPARSVEKDTNVQELLRAETPAISLFGKSWILHVREALKIEPERNLDIIHETIAYLKKHGREVIYDAEHFFDGYKADPEYALQSLRAAHEAGADILVLADTNGGSLPYEILRAIMEVKKNLPAPLGIHAHNDSDLAVANTLAAVQAGCTHVQGTINGYGERCGNANLCSVIPNLQIKMGYDCVPEESLRELTALARYVSEIANLSHPNNMPFVGASAFAHKGGIHVSAVMKNARTYEHMEPEKVGNERRVLVSDLSGRSNILYKSEEIGIDLKKHAAEVPKIVQKIKQLEHEGYQFEAAEASFELLLRRGIGQKTDFFELQGFRVVIEKRPGENPISEASIKVRVNGVVEHTAAEGDGPVNALDNALRKSLNKFFPELEHMKLADYKVRVLNENFGTAAKVRVLIESKDQASHWTTVGSSENIIEASWQALTDSISYFLLKNHLNAEKQSDQSSSQRGAKKEISVLQTK